MFAGSAVSVSALDDARPADTLCLAVDGFDPVPGGNGGISRTGREIAAMRRTHDLRRRIALLGQRLPPALRGDVDIRRCLAEASTATMTILHLVHEGNAADLVAKMDDFSVRHGDAAVDGGRERRRDEPGAPALAGAAVTALRGRRARGPRRRRGPAALIHNLLP